MPDSLLTRLKAFFNPPKRIEEKFMAKKKVGFKLADGKRPKKANGVPGKPFNLQIPIDINLKASGSSVEIDLGISCDTPVVVVPLALGKTKVSANLFAPGESIRVKLTAGNESLSIGNGETVARAYVIDNSDFEVDE